MQEIETLHADEPRRMSIGWKVEEITGMAIVNPRATAEQLQARWAGDILDLRLLPYDCRGGFALMRAPYKQTESSRNSPDGDWMPSVEPDYANIAKGTPVLAGTRHELESVQQAAQTILDLHKQRKEQPGIFKKLRELTGL